MKILSAAQTREADKQTIEHEGISSVALMERAAKAFTGWFENKFMPDRQVFVFCGPGNNGGDGLAVARLLHERHYRVQVVAVGEISKASPDFKANQEALPTKVNFTVATDAAAFPELPEGSCCIDALFGTGLNRPVMDLFAAAVAHLNASGACITAIDIPSGLFTDSQTPAAGAIVKAAYTVSFELPKLAFLLPQHEQYVGEWHVVPIGLSEQYIQQVETDSYYTTLTDVQRLLKPRARFSHKGTYGHALLLCGTYGKMGAAVLAARACLRSGVGLLTIQVPAAGYTVLQTAVPEAMTLTDANKKHLSTLPGQTDRFTAIGAGPGIGTEKPTQTMIGELLATATHPLVLDADAINIIAGSEKLKAQLPKNKVIFTPHPKEFERLAGKSENDFDRLERLKAFCTTHSCYTVLKGNYTVVCTPAGKLYFNSTGNPGMATGGTGDVLTGIITALVAQQYTLEEACLLGVYLHGLAGDLAALRLGEIAMVASDLVKQLPTAFRKLLQV